MRGNSQPQAQSQLASPEPLSSEIDDGVSIFFEGSRAEVGMTSPFEMRDEEARSTSFLVCHPQDKLSSKWKVKEKFYDSRKKLS